MRRKTAFGDFVFAFRRITAIPNDFNFLKMRFDALVKLNRNHLLIFTSQFASISLTFIQESLIITMYHRIGL